MLRVIQLDIVEIEPKKLKLTVSLTSTPIEEIWWSLVDDIE
jgi:hypothetical protein